MAAGRRRILLAEDDAEQRELLAELLELEGFEVLQAGTADEVLVKLDGRPDLVLLDLYGVFDPKLFDAIRTLAVRPKVAILSGDAQVGKVATHLGADGYLAKPYSVADLLALIGNLLSVPVAEPVYV